MMKWKLTNPPPPNLPLIKDQRNKIKINQFYILIKWILKTHTQNQKMKTKNETNKVL